MGAVWTSGLRRRDWIDEACFAKQNKEEEEESIGRVEKEEVGERASGESLQTEDEATT